MDSLRAACLCAQACEDLRGRETLVLDLRKITPLFDFFVISTGTSPRQARALIDAAQEALRLAHVANPPVVKRNSTHRSRTEGYESGDWIVQDYGDIVLHVFQAEKRTLYDLEHLWGDAPRVAWQAQIAKMSEAALA